MGFMDLHMHSDISLDGEVPPEKLAELCGRARLNIVSLTDHNSVRGVAQMKKAAKSYGITVINGVELDCICDGVDLHLLGYGIDITDIRYLDIEQNILGQKQQSSSLRMKMLHDMGIQFADGKVMELARGGVVVGEMIAEAALSDARNQSNPLMHPYFPGGSRCDNPCLNFFWDFCAQGKPAFIPVNYISFEEAVKLIRDTGGTAVIAHPGNTVLRDEEMIRYMHNCGVEGIEAYSSYHNSEQTEYYCKLADRLGMIKTMGSDFHGKTKPSVCLGTTPGHEYEMELTNILKMKNML